MAKKSVNEHRDLQEEYDLWTYLWPRVLGRDRVKWAAVSELVHKTARREHKDNCCGIAADGRTNMGNPPYEGCLYPHRGSVERHLIKLVETGIPAFLCE